MARDVSRATSRDRLGDQTSERCSCSLSAWLKWSARTCLAGAMNPIFKGHNVLRPRPTEIVMAPDHAHQERMFSLAKNAAARFRISTSIFATRNSRRSSASST